MCEQMQVFLNYQNAGLLSAKVFGKICKGIAGHVSFKKKERWLGCEELAAVQHVPNSLAAVLSSLNVHITCRDQL